MAEAVTGGILAVAFAPGLSTGIVELKLDGIGRTECLDVSHADAEWTFDGRRVNARELLQLLAAHECCSVTLYPTAGRYKAARRADFLTQTPG